MRSAHFGDRGAPTVVIAGTAAINGIGFDPATTWAFWRAEANGQQESPFRCDDGGRASMVLVRSYPPTLTAAARLVEMLRDCLDQLAPSLGALGGARLAMVPCLGERFDHPAAQSLRTQRGIIDAACARWAEARGGASVIDAVARGSASLAEAIARAGELLVSERFDAVLVGGPDGSHDADVVQGLLQSQRIFDGKNLDSMIPGEGCALLLLMRPYDAKRAGLAARAVVEGAGWASEPGGMLSDTHVTGDGLAGAIEPLAARAGARGRPVAWIVGDLTNESYRGREHALALPRAFAPGGMDDAGASFAPRATDDVRADWLPLRFGDLGAATMTTGAVIACEAFARGDPSARACLLIGSSVGAARGAVMLAAT